jgi:RNA polymerase sigma factor (sigma-70 family)
MSSKPSHDPAELLAHTDWMRSLARSLVTDSASAEDLVQETWAAFMKEPPRNQDATRSWLARVLRNFAFRRRRTEVHRLRRERIAARPENTRNDPAEILERAEMHHRVVELVLSLDEPYRSTVLSRFFGGLSPPEIARRDGIPVTTVRSRIARALAELRSALDKGHGGDRRAWSLALLPLAGWGLEDLAAAEAAGLGAGVAGSGLSAARNLTLGGFSMTAKKAGLLLASLVLLLGLVGLPVALRRSSREDVIAGAPRVEVAVAAKESPAGKAELESRPVPSDATAPLPETARAPPSLEGKVTGIEGEPVAGARVVAVEAQAWSAPLADVEEKYSGPETGIPALHRAYTSLASQAASTRTAADGTFAFYGFNAGEYRVLVSHPDYLSSTDSTAGVWENETARCDVELPPGAPLKGKVVDEAGAPVPGALIACEASRTAGAKGMAKAICLLAAFSRGNTALEADTTRSGEDGSFSLRSLEPVPQDVKTAKDGFATTWMRGVTPGERAVTLVLHRGVSISGRALAPDGSPLGGVELELQETLVGGGGKGRRAGVMEDFDLLGERIRRGSTGSDGRFRLEGIEAGAYDLIARAKGLPREKRDVRIDKEPVDVGDVEFEAPASIAGIVLGPAGAPLEGAQVRARLPASDGERFRESEREVLSEAVSGAGGRFLLGGLATGTFEVAVTAGAGLRSLSREVETGGQPVVIRLDGGLTIAGTCLDPEGAPVEGASVGLEGVETQVVTAADGSFQVLGVPRENLSRGGIRLRARHPEYQAVSKRIDAEPEERIELRFSAASGPRGIVLDENRNPVPRARVWAEVPGVPTAVLAINPRYGASVWSCRTDDEGAFSLNLTWDQEWGSLEIMAAHARHGLARSSLAPGARAEWPEVEIVLTPGSSIEGRVTGTDGAAIARARVEARPVMEAEVPPRLRDIKDRLPPPRGVVAFTGTDGGYRLGPLAAGSYQIEVSALDHARKVIEPVEVSGPLSRVDVALDSGGAISGRVIGDSGQPIAGAEVLALAGAVPGERSRMDVLQVLGSGGDRVNSTKSDGDGRFELTRLPAGEVTLAALAPGFQPALLEGAAPGERIPDLVLVRYARLSGRVLDGTTGSPVPRFQVRIDFKDPGTGDGTPPATRTERTIEGADGSFVLEDLAPGTYEIKVSSPEHPPFRKRVVLEAAGETLVDARLEVGERLEGVVRVRGTLAAVDGATLDLRHAVSPESPERWTKGKLGVQSGKEGEFVFKGLEAGEYELLVQHPDFFLDVDGGRLAVQLPRDGATPFEVTLAPAGKLSGSLRAQRQLDPDRDRFLFVLARLEEGDGAEQDAGRKAAARSSGAAPLLQTFDLSYTYKWRVEADGSFRASGLRPGRYRIEVYPVRSEERRVGDAVPGLAQTGAARSEEGPPAATAEVELRAGETTEAELEVP